MLKWMVTLIDRIFALIGAIVFSQFPFFIQQYVQLLAGHEAELRLQVEVMQKAATFSGKSLSQYVDKFLGSGDVDFVLQGKIMQQLIERWHQFSQALNSISNSSSFARPFEFFKHLDLSLFKNTAETFKMGIPFTIEGGAYAFAGMMFGYFLFFMIRKFFNFLVRIRMKKTLKS